MHCPACYAKHPSNDTTVHPFLRRKPTRKVENDITEAVHIVNNRPKHALENDQTIMSPHSAASMVNHIPAGSPSPKSHSRQRSGPVPAPTAAASLVNAHVTITPVAVKRQMKPSAFSTFPTPLASPRPFYPPGFGARRGTSVATPSRLPMRNSPPRTEVSILTKERMIKTSKHNNAGIKLTAKIEPNDIPPVTKAVSRVPVLVHTSVVSSPPNTVRRMIDTKRSTNVTPVRSRGGDMKISNVEVLKNKGNISVSQRAAGVTKHGKRDAQIKEKPERVAIFQACPKISRDIKAAVDLVVTGSKITGKNISGTARGKKENELKEREGDRKKATAHRIPEGEKAYRARNIRGGVPTVESLSYDGKKKKQALACVNDIKKIKTKYAQSVRGSSPTTGMANSPSPKNGFMSAPHSNRELESDATTCREMKSLCRVNLGVEDPINIVDSGGNERRKTASPCGESPKRTADTTGDTTSVASLLDETVVCTPHHSGKSCVEEDGTEDASATPSAANIFNDPTAVSPSTGQDISKLQCPVELGDIRFPVAVKQALVQAPAFAPSKGIRQIVGTILAFVAADVTKDYASTQSAVPAACVLVPVLPVDKHGRPCVTKEVREDLRRIFDVETQRVQHTQAALDKLAQFLDSDETTEESVGVKRLSGCDAFLEKSKELHSYLDGVVSIAERLSPATVPGPSLPIQWSEAPKKKVKRTTEGLIEQAESPSCRLACELAEQAKLRAKALERQFKMTGEEENDHCAATLSRAPIGGQASPSPALEKVQLRLSPGPSTPTPGTQGKFTIPTLRRTPGPRGPAPSADDADEQDVNPMKRRYLEWSARKLYERQIASGTPTRTVSAAAASSAEGELPRLSIARHACSRFSLPPLRPVALEASYVSA